MENGRKHGGVGILVRDAVYTSFAVEMCAVNSEGMLGLKLQHRTTGYETIVICNYMPPSNSPYGKDPETFFNNLLTLSFEFADSENVLYCGDFNARIGDCDDSPDSQVRKREVIDMVVNSHGRCLLDFLNDSESCILNGRFGGAHYTCKTANGASVVDYCIVPTNALENVQTFCVKAVDDIVNELSIEYMVEPGSHLPDHELLMLEVKASGLVLDSVLNKEQNENSTEVNHRVPRKFKEGFMKNDRIKRVLSEIIDKLIRNSINQSTVDEQYLQLRNEIVKEMSNFKKVGKRKYTPFKEYWCPMLTKLWKQMRKAYCMARPFLKRKSRRKLKHIGATRPEVTNFLRVQDEFDRELRRAKRCFSTNKVEHIEELVKSGNPKALWDALNKLGPRAKKQTVCEAIDEGGNITRDQEKVMAHWTREFRSLYGDAPVGEFDEDFYLFRVSDLTKMEEDTSAVNTALEINGDITLQEVTRAVKSLKDRKAAGMDKIPNEALKNDTCVMVMTRLFQTCFENGILPSEWSQCRIVPITKGRSSISTDPLSHRGLAMQSCIFKIYCLLLNRRLSSYVEENGLLHECQNGFRKGRSCVDHIYSLTELIKLNQPTPDAQVYACFVDLKKAFLSVNRRLLLWKMNEIGVSGKMYSAIKATYNNPLCALSLPIGNSDLFENRFGTLEGSPI